MKFLLAEVVGVAKKVATEETAEALEGVQLRWRAPYTIVEISSEVRVCSQNTLLLCLLSTLILTAILLPGC